MPARKRLSSVRVSLGNRTKEAARGLGVELQPPAEPFRRERLRRRRNLRHREVALPSQQRLARINSLRVQWVVRHPRSIKSGKRSPTTGAPTSSTESSGSYRDRRRGVQPR